MRQHESIPVPRGLTSVAAWKGAGASLLLHLFVGTAMIAALSGSPGTAPQVIDLTLLPPAETARSQVPPAIVAAAEPPGAAALPESPALPASPAAADPPDATSPANPSSVPASKRSVLDPGSPRAFGTAPGAADHGPVKTAVGSPPETSGAGTAGVGTPAENFTWIRDTIQRAIAYPATARKMGWEGKVVVAFHLLPDGSVRDVRIVRGSGHAALDRGAIDAVRNASPFPRSPVEAEVITPVVYRLTTR